MKVWIELTVRDKCGEMKVARVAVDHIAAVLPPLTVGYENCELVFCAGGTLSVMETPTEVMRRINGFYTKEKADDQPGS